MRLLLFIVVAALLGACDEKPAGEKTTPLVSASPQLRITTLALEDLVMYPEFSAQAQVTSRNISRISAEISARIEALPVEIGQRIIAGKPVAILDCRDAEIALKQAEAQLATTDSRLNLAEQQLKRSEELALKNFISSDALDQRRTEVSIIRAELKLHQAQVEASRRNVSKCVIVSPYDAVVDSKSASAGELASPGTPLLTLWDISGLEVAAEVQQQDTASLAAAKSVSLEIPGAVYPLRLKRISPAFDTAARTREARLDFVKTSPNPGASGRIKWRSVEPYLPADYVLLRGGQYGVFIVDGGMARFVPLSAAQEGRPVQVSLPLDSRIIVEGRFALQDGQEISTPENRSPGQAP